jgi:hypothetical protein
MANCHRIDIRASRDASLLVPSNLRFGAAEIISSHGSPGQRASAQCGSWRIFKASLLEARGERFCRAQPPGALRPPMAFAVRYRRSRILSQRARPETLRGRVPVLSLWFFRGYGRMRVSRPIREQ